MGIIETKNKTGKEIQIIRKRKRTQDKIKENSMVIHMVAKAKPTTPH